MPKYTLVIWDLDGTIVDPEDGITDSVKYALDRLGVSPSDRQILRKFVGPPLFDSFREFLNGDERATEEAVRLYRENFLAKAIDESKAYPGIVDLVRDLSGAGLTQAIATSKPATFAVRILNILEISGYFDHILGSQLDGTNSSKNLLVQEVLSFYPDVTGNEVVVVGDRKYEVEAARSCGVESIAVSYGFGTREEISAAKPTHIADSAEDIRKIVLG